MCYNGKCMHFLEVETGALIFAILNVMVTSLGSVVSVVGLVYTNFVSQEVIHRANEENDEKLMAGAMIYGMATNILFIALAVGFSIAFSFAVVLIVGLCKRKANLVKCYFVYGVVKMVFGVASILGLTMNSDVVPVICVMLLIYGIYALILTMVRMTYKKFEAEGTYQCFSNPMSAVEKF